MKFNSQICTTREQSQRLLSLGLKRETADCYLFEYEKGKYKIVVESWIDLIADKEYYSEYKEACIPAWSLHRLIKFVPIVLYLSPVLYLTMLGESVFYCTEDNDEACERAFSRHLNLYDNMIDCIEWLIKEGKFCKEYLLCEK